MSVRPEMPAGTMSGGSSERQYSGAAVGVTAFAGVLMILGGCFHVIQGFIALLEDEFFVKTPNYVFQFDLTTWGWIHLIGGLIVGAAGIAVFAGQVWARTVGVIVACVSILLNFAWLPYYPIWSLVVIAFSGFAIWALTVHGRDIAEY